MPKKKRIKKPEGQEAQWRTPQKREKGKGVFRKEPKSETAKLALTPSSKARLQQLANLNKISMSEYIERWLRCETEELILP
jgi:hypothetical protein